MSDKEQYSLMIWCGALWDIAEKSKEHHTQKQVEDVREQIEKLILKRQESVWKNDTQNMRYILENTTVKSEERFYGDHYPAFLEREEYAWNYSKEEADKKIIELGDEWKAIISTPILKKRWF